MSTTIYVATFGVLPTGTALTPEAAQREALREQKQSPEAARYDYRWFEHKPGEWRLLRKPSGGRLAPAEWTGRTVREVPFTPDEATVPVDGPFPVRVRATPAGAELDVSAFLFQAVFAEVISQADDDPTGFVDELRDMADLLRAAVHGGPDSSARHEFDERMRLMLKQYADDGVIPVYGAAVGRLAERLSQIAAPRPVPGQREAGAA
ncbi:hypothetical protein ACFCYB_00495 [Streptomyces sp. NPDC056309]|uniref:hypothetical protein n=1 Tax=Streptomyces sp. NPDC056309 TaxID=3345781 RepID=UPI0035E2DF36